MQFFNLDGLISFELICFSFLPFIIHQKTNRKKEVAQCIAYYESICKDMVSCFCSLLMQQIDFRVKMYLEKQLTLDVFSPHLLLFLNEKYE